MTTIARPTSASDAHFYDDQGNPRHWIENKSKPGTFRKTNKTDALKHRWRPSVTTVLKVAAKPELTNWLIEQAVLTVLTAPRKAGEELDQFIQRVLKDEKQQDAEAQAARDLGTRIHDALEKASRFAWLAPESTLEKASRFEPIDTDLHVYLEAPLAKLRELGRVVETEKVVLGDGYAGKLDVLLENDDEVWVIDFKSAKTLPTKAAWPDHSLQLAGYSAALGNTGNKRVRCGNIYISTTAPGEMAWFETEDWPTVFRDGFMPFFAGWKWMNNFYPKEENHGS